MDSFNKFFAVIVKVDYALYIGIGLLIGLVFHLLEQRVLGLSDMKFLASVVTPIGMYAFVVGVMAAIFYQDIYGKLTKSSSGRINRGYQLPIPRVDTAFYSTITRKDLNYLRKSCGYIYAFSKPFIAITFGLAIVPLINIVSN